ncbi:MAG TPA: DUF3536 domain-containing protein, partial [Kofleriaceae bacterium]|nr:DUF3536 domain-containing protein [Kofleriaceae bacterium]
MSANETPRADRWVCVHGHFYQPPRENPWTGVIDRQPSATPFHDWNQRITTECYRANTAVPVMDAQGRIARLVDNYACMSWNMGPTLLSWLREQDRSTYDAIVMADRASRERFGGHGSAMAQAHGHVIMPLASQRDKVTQVRWGIADFVWRFGRQPEGMWLPECAVDTETLEVMAAEGILFTVLAPHQAAAWRPIRTDAWQTGPIETGRVYRCPLPSGRSIDLFFYDGPVAQAVAFEKLLADGARFVDRLRSRGPLEASSPPALGQPPLCHIATDGESYGHHHRFGDMALAWAFDSLARDGRTRLTNYGEYRARFPAQHDVQIVEDSSWSCAHGTLRWREDCGCNSGGRPGWRQAWRRPLRAALEWLRDQIDRTLDDVGGLLLKDPWAARDAYIAVVLDGGERNWTRFFATHGNHALTEAEQQQVRLLMATAHHGMSMFTSCGWFFDDLSGIETVQVMRYAARAAELLEQVGGGVIMPALLDRLALAHSNLLDEGDGRLVWQRHVEPARRDALLASTRHNVLAQVAGVEAELAQLFARARSLYPDARAALGELPTSLRTVAQLVLRRQAIEELSHPVPSFERLRFIVETAQENAVSLDEPAVAKAASAALTALLARCEDGAREGAPDVGLFKTAAASALAVRELFPSIDLFGPR